MTSRPSITITARAAAAAEGAAENALPRETGGILLGWRHDPAGNGFHVVGALEVVDPKSGRATYHRRHARAQTALAAALVRLDDPDIGYVGEWHSHPQPQGPSPLDRHSIRCFALRHDNPIVLVVPALARDGHWTWHGLVASRRRVAPFTQLVPAAVHHEGTP